MNYEILHNCSFFSVGGSSGGGGSGGPGPGGSG